MTFELGEAIAERELLFVPEDGQPHSVLVKLGRPVADPRAPDRSWYCPYQIQGIGQDRVFAIFGVDAMEALALALHTVPIELAIYVRSRRGQLLHGDAPDTMWLSGCRTAIECAGNALPQDDGALASVGHHVDVRQPAPFLRRVMRELAGQALLALEGNLGDPLFPEDWVVSRHPVGLLKRNTVAPPFDFLVLRLEPDLVDGIFAKVSRVGLRDDIVHVQIEKRGRLELRAYDNFHSDCVLTGPGVAPELLAELQASGIIRSFCRAGHRA